MIKQVTESAILLQQYFISFCQYVIFYVKKLCSLTEAPNGHNRSNGAGRKLSKGNLRPSSEIPGPKCYPLIGSLLEFNKYGPRRVHELSVKRHEQYGDIFREKIFSQELVFVANTDLLKQWMVQEGKYPESLSQEPGEIFKEQYPHLKRGLFLRSGEEWFRLRKLSHILLNKNAADFTAERLYDNLEDFLDGYVEELKKVVLHGENKGEIEDLELIAYNIALGCTVSLVYGKNQGIFKEYTGTDLKTLSENAKVLNDHHRKLLEMPARLAKWFNTADWVGYSSRLEQNLNACIKFGRLRREDMLKSPESASMKSYGILYKSLQVNIASEAEIDDILSDFAVDSKDPLSATFMFTTLVLGAYPDIQEKIFAEVSRIYPGNDPITFSKVKKLEYTEGFFKEVVRLYPVAAFTARVAKEETIIGDYAIPPGAWIMYSSFVVHRDPRYFKNPLQVIPERWMTGKTIGLENSLNKDEEDYGDITAFAGFGLKARLCIGQNVATSLFTLYLARLVRNFKLRSGLPEAEMKTVLYPTQAGPLHLEIR